MRHHYYQQKAEPFPQTVPFQPLGWMVNVEDRPVPARWRPWYQEYVSPFINPGAPYTPPSWMIEVADRPVSENPMPPRWRPPYQETVLWPLPLPPENLNLTPQWMAALQPDSPRPRARFFRPDDTSARSYWLPNPGTTVSSVASWYVEQTVPVRRSVAAERRELGSGTAFVAIVPPPDFGRVPPTDIVYYRVAQTDQVYYREEAPSFDKAPFAGTTDLTGSVSTVVTMGYGSFSSVNLVATLGYSIAAPQNTVIVDQVFYRSDDTDQVFRRAN